ncbi:hypothetical protein PIB30_106051, partial [Stylosanthes scabra]|nr:hypothetical protein [Stylosanthes scabra]
MYSTQSTIPRLHTLVSRRPCRSCIAPSPSPSLFPALSSLARYCKPPHHLAVHCSPRRRCSLRRRGGTVKLNPALVTSSPLVLRSSVPDGTAPPRSLRGSEFGSSSAFCHQPPTSTAVCSSLHTRCLLPPWLGSVTPFILCSQ